MLMCTHALQLLHVLVLRTSWSIPADETRSVYM